MQDLSGKDIGRYHIIEKLGRGGMAEVFKAYDTHLEREVAIKFIRREEFGQSIQDHVLKRFEREGKSLARMMHPNIVPVHDYGEYEGTPYLVMAYIPGGTLKERTGAAMPYAEAARLLAPIARALAYAHENKVLHRDVKPANILMTANGEPMLSDFGIAKILEGDKGGTLTGTGVGIGTPEYMAPEQGMGDVADERVDIYSLGVMFYELVTGQKPFTADTPMAVIIKHVTDPLPRPRQFVADLPDEVEQVIFKAMAKSASNRYENMALFAAELERLAKMSPGAETPISQTQIDRANPIAAGEEIRSSVFESGGLKKPGPAGLPRWVWLGGGLLVLLAIVGLSWNELSVLVVGSGNQNPNGVGPVVSIPAITGNATPAKLVAGSTRTMEMDGMLQVYVPAGKFLMGSSDTDSLAEADEKPQHTVELDAYWIDSREVSNAQYALCVSAGVCSQPHDTTSWTRDAYYGASQYADFPVIHVDWSQAAGYCAWAGRRLPSEAEWEKAARGTDGRIYPWGDSGVAGHMLNFADVNTKFSWSDVAINDGYPDTAPVGNYADGASPYGALDMAGNVWEWVNDWYGETAYQETPAKNPTGPDSGQGKVYRGGSWYFDAKNARAANRAWVKPDYWSKYTGFRCASSEK